jgi:STE24 endopeptidase
MAMMTVLMLVPEISASYGFALPTILFAYYVSFGFYAEAILPIVSFPVNAITRAMERRADTFACKKGYGDDLVSALKRLHKDSLSNMNPHPLVVKLEYNHPALHERINLVEKIKSGKN